MAVGKGKAVTTPAKTEVATWAGFMKQAALKQQRAAATITSGGVVASFRGGHMQVGGTPIKDNALDVIILCIMQERAYYVGEYDPDTPRSPACYAYGPVDGEDPVEPHEKCAQPQSENCESCDHSQWGTSKEGTRRGQACKQQLKLAFVIANTKATAEDLSASVVYYARLPPSSLKFAKSWLDEIGVQDANATFAWITRMSLTPSSKNIFDVILERGNAIRHEWQSAVPALVAKAQLGIVEAYPGFEEEAPAKPAKPGAVKKKY